MNERKAGALIFLACVIGLALLVCCAPATDRDDAQIEHGDDTKPMPYNSARFIDREAGVVCYVHGGTGGISCLPLNETWLDE